MVDQSRILPVMQSQDWLDMIRTTVPDNSVPYSEHLAGDLLVIYAEHRESGYIYLSDRFLEGIDRGALRNIAVTNLLRIFPEREIRELGRGVCALTGGGDYQASFLLLDDLWSERAAIVDGEIVVAVPSRDLLIFAGANNPEGVEAVGGFARKYVADDAYPVTASLFIYRQGRFFPYGGH